MPRWSFDAANLRRRDEQRILAARRRIQAIRAAGWLGVHDLWCICRRLAAEILVLVSESLPRKWNYSMPRTPALSLISLSLVAVTLGLCVSCSRAVSAAASPDVASQPPAAALVQPFI